MLTLLARRFQLLGEPMRLRLLDRLRDGEATVRDLADDLATSQQNVSKHLGMLFDGAIVARRNEGTRVQYRIGDAEIFALCDRVCGSQEHQLRDAAAPASAIGRFFDEHLLARQEA